MRETKFEAREVPASLYQGPPVVSNHEHLSDVCRALDVTIELRNKKRGSSGLAQPPANICDSLTCGRARTKIRRAGAQRPQIVRSTPKDFVHMSTVEPSPDALPPCLDRRSTLKKAVQGEKQKGATRAV
jgi:hypothetical protein